MITIDSLKKDFYELGVREGDTVLVRGNLGKVGRVKKNIFIDALLLTVGESGTIMTLTFTKSFPFYKIDKNFVYTKKTKSNSGALSKIFLENPNVKRSSHPTNSYAAIGKKAEFLIQDHTENSLSYDPIKKLVSLNAKMVIFGILDDSPGFTTVHLAQQELGLTKQSFFKNFFRVFYQNEDGKIKLFKREDIGGCSGGFGKFYQYYLSEGVLNKGMVGNAPAMLINAQDSYNIEYKLLEENNSFHFCDNPFCFSCRCGWKYNMKYILSFVVLKIISLIKGEK